MLSGQQGPLPGPGEGGIHFRHGRGKTRTPRPPRGYTADLPLIDDLKRKDCYVSAKLDPKSVTADDFPARLEALWAHATLFMRFVTQALALPF